MGWPSFQRQLHIYVFTRFSGKGPDKNGYYHRMFLRGKPHLSDYIIRKKIKGTKVRRAVEKALEPNYYTMPYVGVDSPLPKCSTSIDTVPQSSSLTPCTTGGHEITDAEPIEKKPMEEMMETTSGEQSENVARQENRRRLRNSFRLSFSADKLLSDPLIEIDEVDNNDFKDPQNRKRWVRSSLRTSFHSGSFSLPSIKQLLVSGGRNNKASSTNNVEEPSLLSATYDNTDDYLDGLPDDEEVWGKLLDSIMDATPELKRIVRKSFSSTNNSTTKAAKTA